MNDELFHYGVKGMKWGVRKDPKSTKKDTTPTQDENRSYRKNDHWRKKKKTVVGIGIGVGIATTVATGAYIAYRYRNRNCDVIIKSGTDMQRMARLVDENLNRPFYASYLKRDNRAYAENDFFGSHWSYRKVLTPQKNLRVAGKKTVLTEFADWVKTDPVAEKKFEGLDVKDRKSLQRAYDLFNRDFMSPDVRDRSLRDSYLSRLASKGYDAVRDRNDQMYSGMQSPIFMFGSLGEIKVKDIIRLTNQ